MFNFSVTTFSLSVLAFSFAAHGAPAIGGTATPSTKEPAAIIKKSPTESAPTHSQIKAETSRIEVTPSRFDTETTEKRPLQITLGANSLSYNAHRADVSTVQAVARAFWGVRF